jgi:sulfatase-modifying factor enzyme 1
MARSRFLRAMVLVPIVGCSIIGGAGPEKAAAGNPDGKDDGAECDAGDECKSGVCTGTCAAPLPNDGVKNGDEADTDCGGTQTPKCEEGKTCTEGKQCKSGACNEGTCAAGAPNDGAKNGDETDVDCGGSSSPKCATGKACNVGDNCESLVCKGSKCQAPSPTDGVKNGDESDVDCGGTKTGAPKCAANKGCNKHDDCASDGCAYTKKCATGKSCTAHNGGDTCGSGEVGDPAAKHESCCVALPAPGVAGRLDKYQITAGRMRAFLERVNGDVRSFIKANRPKGWNAAWDEYVPNGFGVDPTLNDGNDPNFYRRARSSVWHQLGGSVLYDQNGDLGCYLKGIGAQTYWKTDTVQTQDLGDIPHKYPQDALDVKSIQCVTQLMVAAFCHWDGGRLPTIGELDAAWGSAKYPWGDGPPPQGFDGEPAGGDPTRANYKLNYFAPVFRIDPDYSVHVSAPGRFPKGKGPYGHMDLAGNIFEVTSTYKGGETDPSQLQNRWSRNGSWEVHAIPYDVFYAPLLRKYGKQGGRCARP